MKIRSIILFFVLLMSSFQLFAGAKKEKIILALNSKGVLNVTAKILSAGVTIGKDSLPKSIQDKYEIEHIDIGTNLKETMRSLTNSIETKKPIAIIGGITSNEALYINAVSKKFNIPFLTPFATNPKVTTENELTFRLCFDDQQQVSKIVSFIKGLKLKKGIVLVNSKQSYSIGVGNKFKNLFQTDKNEIKIIKFQKINEISNNYLKSIVQFQPEFILIPSYQVEAATIISQISSSLPDVSYFGTDSWGGGRLFHNIIKGIPQSITGYYIQHWSPLNQSNENQNFLNLVKKNKYLKKFSSTAMLAPAAVGYDAIKFTIKAHQLALKKQTSLPNAIKSITYKGATGKTSLNESRNPTKKLFIYKLSNSTETFLK